MQFAKSRLPTVARPACMMGVAALEQMNTEDIRPARHVVSIEDSGVQFTCRAGENILKAMERLNRQGIPVGCRGGGCGVCKIKVTKGTYSLRRMSRAHVSAEEEMAGIGLACCTLPTSDLSLKVLGSIRTACSVDNAVAGTAKRKP